MLKKTVFNESTIAQIQVSMSEQDLMWLLNPVNQDETKYFPAGKENDKVLSN